MAKIIGEELLARFNGNSPATEFAIREFERESGLRLPQDYERFLRQTNGGEGFVGPNAYVILWRVEELLELNRAYEVSVYAPGLFLFGSDGGGEAFAFDVRSNPAPTVSVPFVGMDRSLARPIGTTFTGFLQALAQA